MPQYFTHEQANAALALIRPLMARLMRIRDEILGSQPEVWPVIQKGAGNGGSKLAGEMAFRFKEVDDLVRRIQAMGVVIKDLNTGLVDFPAWREGREVYLCWRLDEPVVSHWHELDSGFAGRKKLSQIGRAHV